MALNIELTIMILWYIYIKYNNLKYKLSHLLMSNKKQE